MFAETDFRTAQEFPPLQRDATRVAHQTSIERVIGYMKTHLDEPLDLQHLAVVAAISKFHFVKVFERVTGTTPHHFLACLRMQRAKERLLHSAASVTDICLEVGYSSLGSFSQTFSELVGVAPKEFRAMPARLTLGQLAGAARRWIAGYRAPAVPQIEGVIDAPMGSRGFIFVGTFGSGVPQGVPASGAVLLRPGAFRIARPAGREFHLLAAQIPFTARMSEMVANLAVEHVASQRLRRDDAVPPASIRLRLRRLRVTDPPIVMALPALLP